MRFRAFYRFLIQWAKSEMGIIHQNRRIENVFRNVPQHFCLKPCECVSQSNEKLLSNRPSVYCNEQIRPVKLVPRSLKSLHLTKLVMSSSFSQNKLAGVVEKFYLNKFVASALPESILRNVCAGKIQRESSYKV